MEPTTTDIGVTELEHCAFGLTEDNSVLVLRFSEQSQPLDGGWGAELIELPDCDPTRWLNGKRCRGSLLL